MPELSTDKLLPRHPNIDYESASEIFFTPHIEECEPLLTEALLFEADGCTHQNVHDSPSKHLDESNLKARRMPRRVLGRSSSDQNVRRRARQYESPIDPMQMVLHRNDPTVDSGTLQQRLIKQTRRPSKPAVRPWRVRRVRTASGPLQWTNPRLSGSPGFKWFPVRSNTDPSSTPRVGARLSKRGKDLPLKPCMKQKSKSTTTTPPSGQISGTEDLQNGQKLRRAKTVDFDESVSKKLLSLPLLKAWGDEPKLAPSGKAKQAKERTTERLPGVVKTLNKARACPGPKMKSKPADTAITRTDVHVVAIVPSWSLADAPSEGDIDPPTPTMQVVESKTGCYEVVWDDVPSGYTLHPRRRSSSASHSLHMAGSTGRKGLDRVNTKLTEWSWARGSLRTPSFKPQVVVFPEEDGCPPHIDCAVDDEDSVMLAPPNSERTSANPSQPPSYPVSAHSREASHDEPPSEPYHIMVHLNEKRDSKQDPLATCDSKVGPIGSCIGVSRGVRKPSMERRLSNLEDSEVRFRGHRDSVTLARSRIFNAGGVSPELFMHRDSISMAKKRMHARNHAISVAREIPQSNLTVSEPLATIDDVDASPPASKIQSALKGLKNSASTSMLTPQSANNHRHIRIIE